MNLELLLSQDPSNGVIHIFMLMPALQHLKVEVEGSQKLLAYIRNNGNNTIGQWLQKNLIESVIPSDFISYGPSKTITLKNIVDEKTLSMDVKEMGL